MSENIYEGNAYGYVGQSGGFLLTLDYQNIKPLPSGWSYLTRAAHEAMIVKPNRLLHPGHTGGRLVSMPYIHFENEHWQVVRAEDMPKDARYFYYYATDLLSAAEDFARHVSPGNQSLRDRDAPLAGKYYLVIRRVPGAQLPEQEEPAARVARQVAERGYAIVTRGGDQLLMTVELASSKRGSDLITLRGRVRSGLTGQLTPCELTLNYALVQTVESREVTHALMAAAIRTAATKTRQERQANAHWDPNQ